MADFENEMSTILAALSWTSCTTQPQTNYGTVNTSGSFNPLANLRVRNGEDDTLEYTTFAGNVVVENQRGTVEGKAQGQTSLDNMITDLKNGLPGQGVVIEKIVRAPRHTNVYRFYMNLQRLE